MAISKQKTLRIPLSQIEPDPVGDMLAESDGVKPYINYYCALATGVGIRKTLAVMAALPVDKRYLFRLVQCLDWALADYDDCTVELDMPYMPDLENIKERLQIRLWQLRDLLATLGGK